MAREWYPSLFSEAAALEREDSEPPAQKTLATSLDQHKMVVVKAAIGYLQKADQKLSFRKAWEIVQAKRPELFEEPKEASAAAVRIQAVSNAEEPALADVPEPYRSDPWYH